MFSERVIAALPRVRQDCWRSSAVVDFRYIGASPTTEASRAQSQKDKMCQNKINDSLAL